MERVKKIKPGRIEIRSGFVLGNQIGLTDGLFPFRDEMSRTRRRCRHCRGDEMRASALALPAFKIAV